MSRKLVMRASVVAMVGLLLLTAVVDAQQGQRGRGRRGFGGGGFFGPGGGGVDLLGLMRVEKVQQELELVEDQTAAVNELMEEQRGGRGRGPGRRGGPGGGPGGPGRGFGDLSEEERRERFAELQQQREERAKQNEEKLAEILLPHQLDRLKEIQFQTMGTGALQNAEVAAKLGINEDQKKKLETVNQENRDAMFAKMGELRQGGNFEGMREAMTKLRAEADEKVLGVLSDKQKEQFAAMKGEPFEMPPNAFGRGFGGRGRGGPGGGGRPERPARPARPEA